MVDIKLVASADSQGGCASSQLHHNLEICFFVILDRASSQKVVEIIEIVQVLDPQRQAFQEYVDDSADLHDI